MDFRDMAQALRRVADALESGQHERLQQPIAVRLWAKGVNLEQLLNWSRLIDSDNLHWQDKGGECSLYGKRDGISLECEFTPVVIIQQLINGLKSIEE